METVLFVALLAVAALLRWIAKRSEEVAHDDAQTPESRSTPLPRSDQPITRTATTSEEERIRKFLEALGVPTDSSPPPPVAPRSDIPPRPVVPIQPPPEMVPGTFPSRPREVRRKVVMPDTRAEETFTQAQPVAPPVVQERVQPARKGDSPGFEVGDVVVVPPLSVEQKRTKKRRIEEPVYENEIDRTVSSFAADLTSREGLRRAIVLREIFGPPRSLQKFDEIGNLAA